MSNRVRVRVIKGFTFCDHFKIAQKKNEPPTSQMSISKLKSLLKLSEFR